MSPALGFGSLGVIAAGLVIGVAAAQAITPGLGGPRPEASEVERKIFADGLRQFSRAWEEADGVGERFNEHSCLGCHSAPAAGGSGVAPNTFVLVAGSVDDGNGGHVFRRLHRTADAVTELLPPAGASKRKPPSLFGLGLLELAELRQPAAPAPGPDRIVGKIGGTAERPGRFGWKARVPDIKTFVAAAFAQELGMSAEPTSGHNYPLELATAEVAAFVTLLAPPPRQELDEPARAGERIFAEIGCAQCHTPSLAPAPEAEAELGYRPEIRAYTDLLLHDMGPDFADAFVEGKAGPADFRTAPLWGLAASGPPYLHDGRAKDVTAAIALHDGDAKPARLRWEQLPPADRAALLSFLRSL
ncbi:MAG TPA: di-heme oxidoredictase family protein [Stellaceae bacterium]